jgi:hypothetical protein
MRDFGLINVGKNAFVEGDSLARKKKREPIQHPANPPVGRQNPLDTCGFEI